RDIALQEADAKEGGSDEEANESRNIHSAARGHGFGSRRPGKRRDEQCYGEQLENRGDSNVPQHHNPMQLGLILDGFTRDEMLFDVAQGSSLHAAAAMGPGVLRRSMAANGSGP